MYYICVDGPLLSTYLSTAVSSILTRKVDTFLQAIVAVFKVRWFKVVTSSWGELTNNLSEKMIEMSSGLNQIWWGKVL